MKKNGKPFINLGAPGTTLIHNESPHSWHMDFCLITYNFQKHIFLSCRVSLFKLLKTVTFKN